MAKKLNNHMADTAGYAAIYGHRTNVLVTGGGGFIGSHLVEHLVSSNARVTILDNMQAGKLENIAQYVDQVNFIEGDIRNPVLVERIVRETQPRYVFHLAANASVPGSVHDPAYDFESNAAGTFVLLNALRASGKCEKAVIASSGAVYGEPTRFPISEEDMLLPISPYGASKLSAEIEARMFHKVYGLPVTIARLFNAYGPKMARFVILDFLKKLKKDASRLEILGNGKQVRDFTYVADTVQGLMTLALYGEPGEAYNISSGSYYNVTDLARRIIAARGLTDVTQISYSGNSWVGDAQRWEVSIAKLQALGYQTEVTLDDGLQRTAAWFDMQNFDNL